MSHPAPPAGGAILPPPAARTLYNVADALFPPGPDGRPGGGDVDVLPGVERRLRWAGLPAIRRVRLLLWWIEWRPRFGLGGRRGFSALPRSRRRALLERLAGGRGFEALRAAIREALVETDAVPDQPSGT